MALIKCNEDIVERYAGKYMLYNMGITYKVRIIGFSKQCGIVIEPIEQDPKPFGWYSNDSTNVNSIDEYYIINAKIGKFSHM